MFAAAPDPRGPRGLRMWLRLVRGIAVLAIVVGAWSWQPITEGATPAREATAVTTVSAAPAAEISAEVVAAPPVEPAAADTAASTPATEAAVPPRGADRSTAGVRAPPHAA
ncbi:hypothetical protein WEI85_17760 [Actinomycetes bacterium KLBMP 9797]